MLNTTRILALADLAEKQESKQEFQGPRTMCAIGALTSKYIEIFHPHQSKKNSSICCIITFLGITYHFGDKY